MPVELLAKEAARPGTAPLYRGYAFDLDGTLYLGENLIEGADIVVAALRASGARVVFVTNKPLETAENYAAKLTKLGIPAVAEDVISALDALTLYLTGRHPGARVLQATFRDGFFPYTAVPIKDQFEELKRTMPKAKSPKTKKQE